VVVVVVVVVVAVAAKSDAKQHAVHSLKKV